MKWLSPTLVVALLLVACQPSAGPPSADEPRAVVAAFQQALARGDAEAAKALLAPDVLIYEFGGQEASVAEYAASHLGADMEFLKGATIGQLDQRQQADGALAVVTTRTRVKGAYKDKPFDQFSTETMVLARAGGHWRITHIHWSSRAAPQPAG